MKILTQDGFDLFDNLHTIYVDDETESGEYEIKGVINTGDPEKDKCILGRYSRIDRALVILEEIATCTDACYIMPEE